MKSTGFRKRGRSFNRIVYDNIVHVLNFQAGQYPIGDNYVIPGLRESMYGNFAVNLGVYVPAVAALEQIAPAPAFFQDYDCHIRERLGTLITEGNDIWWSATDSIQDTADRFPSLFDRYAIPFFSRFLTRDCILDEWRRSGSLPGCNAGRSNLVAAILLNEMGDSQGSADAFRSAIASNQIKGFHGHVRSIAKKCDIEL